MGTQQWQDTEQSKQYFVPLSLLTTRGDGGRILAPGGGEPNISEQQRVQAITWSLVERPSGAAPAQLKWRKTAMCQTASDQLNSDDLAEALRQLQESLASAPGHALVVCGPLNLRQQLYPIARRLGVQLESSTLGQYFDLVKEFERTPRGARLAGLRRRKQRQQPQQQQQQQQQQACCQHRTDFYPSCANEAPATKSQQQRESGCCFCYACCFESVQAAHSNGSQSELHDGGPNAPQRRRVGEMLAALASQTDEWQWPVLECAKCASASNGGANNQVAPPSAPNHQQQQPNGASSEPFASLRRASGSNNDNNNGCADSTPSGHCLECSLLHNEHLVDSMSTIVRRLLNEGHQFARLEHIKRRVEVGLCEVPAHEAEFRLVRARGLPWQATEQDIADFFIGLNIAKGGVSLCLSRQGRRNGEALVQFESREHRNLALARHKHFMGQRYIEVYKANGEDFMQVATACNNNKAEAFLTRGAQVIVRARGLPFTCTAKQVVDFFAATITSEQQSHTSGNGNRRPLQTAHGKSRVLRPSSVLAGEDGVLFVKKHDDKPTGDAFVLFATEEDAQRALAKHHENIGARYVELFRSSVSEVQQVLSISSSLVGPAQDTQRQLAQAGRRSSPRRQQRQQSQQQQQQKTDSQVTYAQLARSPVGGETEVSDGAATADAAEQAQQEQVDPSKSDAAQSVPSHETKATNEQCSSDSSSPTHNAGSSAASTVSSASSHARSQAASSNQRRNHHHSYGYQSYRAQRMHGVNCETQSSMSYAPHHLYSAAYAPLDASGPHQHYHQYHHQHHYQHYQQPAQIAYQTLGTMALSSERDCVRLRGLPYEAEIEHVLEFLGKHSDNILLQGVHMVLSAQGQPTGEAVIQMVSAEAAALAARDTHKCVMQLGKRQRYIEVMAQSLDELRPSLGYGLAAALAARSGYVYAPGCPQQAAPLAPHQHTGATYAGRHDWPTNLILMICGCQT